MSFIKKLSVKLQASKLRFKENVSHKKLKSFHQHDQKLVQILASNKKIPSWKQLKYISEYLTKFEKIIIRLLSGIIIIALASLFINIYWNHSELVPKDGGSYTEGLVGLPRYINPLFAQANDVDFDLSGLIYSGLFKYTDEGLTKDLTESYEISTDQKVYTIKIREDVKWHDNEQLDADDVLFTFNRINDTKTKTPLYFNFKGSTVEKVDDYTVKFSLSEPFAPFLESLNVGILPEHLWKNAQPENMTLAEFNLKPIGSGPYKFKSLIKNKAGEIKSFNLERNTEYYNGVPHIKDLTFKFYQGFEAAVEALNNKTIEGISYLPKEIRARIINNRNLNFNLLQLPQYTATFFNYRENPVLKDVTIRKILSHAVDKEKIANEILNAEAQIIDGPILPGTLGYISDTVKFPYNPQHAKAELEKAEWLLNDYTIKTETKNEEGETVITEEQYAYQVRKKGERYLEFNLTTVNQAETVKIAKEIQKDWQQIGAKINLVIVDPNEIQNVIKNRNYEILLYSQILGYDPDPFPFWHSSQSSHPGLNLTSLNNPTIDTLLDEARKITDDTKRAEKYTEFQTLMAESVPAIFLFNTTYTYPQNKKIKGFDAERIILPSNRFNQVQDWYIKTSRNWKK